MKKILFLSILLLMLFSCKTTYKLGQCNDLYVDLEKGTLNGINGMATVAEVKKAFPCFTGESKEGEMANCGGGVFFLKNNFHFYTFNDYIEIRRNFKGKLSKDVLNKSLQNLHAIMGKPDTIIEKYGSTNNLDIGINYYQKPWGVLTFKEDNDLIIEVQLYYNKTIESINYCY